MLSLNIGTWFKHPRLVGPGWDWVLRRARPGHVLNQCWPGARWLLAIVVTRVECIIAKAGCVSPEIPTHLLPLGEQVRSRNGWELPNALPLVFVLKLDVVFVASATLVEEEFSPLLLFWQLIKEICKQFVSPLSIIVSKWRFVGSQGKRSLCQLLTWPRSWVARGSTHSASYSPDQGRG